MANKSIGKTIRTLRKEKCMTQKELANMLSVTDKAVSKWERDVACPDTLIIPQLAEILGISVEELLNAKASPAPKSKDTEYIITLILKIIPLAMGIAVAVTALLDKIDVKSGFTMLGIGLACVGLYLLKSKKN